MLRCRRCHQVVALFAAGCLGCAEVMAKKDVQLYISPDLHTHQEPKAPTPVARPSIAALSTTAPSTFLSPWWPAPTALKPSSSWWT